MKNNVKGNLRFKFVLTFFCIMLIAGALSVLIAILAVGQGLQSTLHDGQLKVAETILSLYEGGEFDSSDDRGVLEMASTGLYSIKRLEPSSPTVMEYSDRLDGGEIVFVKLSRLPFSNTLLKVSSHYYEISIFPNSTLLFGIIFAVIFSIMSVIATGTLISSFAGKRFLKPIRELCSATGMVAKGDFSIRVAEPHNRELRALVSNFNQMTNDLGGIETLQRDFIDNVSHEFKTPLASIRGFAELLQNPQVDANDRIEYAEIIASESNRLSNLSSNILKLSKLENTEIVKNTEEFSLDEQIRRVILMLEPQWTAKSIELCVELEPATVCANDELMRQVWQNLLENAIKFTPENGWIEVKLTNKEKIYVEISDTGSGISKENIPHIFDKFYQCDRSHSGMGNGLGLPLVKRIVELSGGDITVESEPDTGSKFIVALNKPPKKRTK